MTDVGLYHLNSQKTSKALYRLRRARQAKSIRDSQDYTENAYYFWHNATIADQPVCWPDLANNQFLWTRRKLFHVAINLSYAICKM